MKIKNLHPDGAAYSSGDGKSRVLILFESPGKSEVMMDAPLSGVTGKRYCQIVRKLRDRLDTGETKSKEFEWAEFCKDNATVINVFPCYTQRSPDAIVGESLNIDNLKSVQSKIRDRHELLFCFGRAACEVVDKLLESDGGIRCGDRTILKFWHISPENPHSYITNIEKSEQWGEQLNLFVEYVLMYCTKKGVFGWDEINQIRECQWRHKGEDVDPPKWLKGKCVNQNT